MSENRVQLSDEVRKRAQDNAGYSAAQLTTLAEIFTEAMGPNLRAPVAGVRVRIGTGAKVAPEAFAADAKMVVPDVTVFVDENENCVGMYVDPPGICTDEC